MKIKELINYLQSLDPETTVIIRNQIHLRRIAIGKHGDEIISDPEFIENEDRTLNETDLEFSEGKELLIKNFAEIWQDWAVEKFNLSC